MSSSTCCFLTCIQISQEAGQVVWYSHLFQNFSQFIVIHTVKGFGIVNKAEIDVFLELSCFFDDPADVGNLISSSSAFSKSSLNIWKLTVHGLLKSVLEDFEHYFTSVWNECNCVVAFWLRSSGGSDGKRLSTMWETWVRSLGREVPWRRQRQPTPVLLPRKSPGRRSLVSMGSQRVGHDWATSLSCLWLFVTPWIVAHQAPLSMGLSSQEYWSGLLFPPPGDLPDPGIEFVSPTWPVGSLPLRHLGNSKW